MKRPAFQFYPADWRRDGVDLDYLKDMAVSAKSWTAFRNEVAGALE